MPLSVYVHSDRSLRRAWRRTGEQNHLIIIIISALLGIVFPDSSSSSSLNAFLSVNKIRSGALQRQQEVFNRFHFTLCVLKLQRSHNTSFFWIQSFTGVSLQLPEEFNADPYFMSATMTEIPANVKLAQGDMQIYMAPHVAIKEHMMQMKIGTVTGLYKYVIAAA